MPSTITAMATILVLAILPSPGGQPAIDRHNLAVAVSSNNENGITGQVNIRPGRPHATLGAPNLAPYQTKLEVSDTSGHVVANVETDANGQLRVGLPPGTVRPQAAVARSLSACQRADDRRVAQEVQPSHGHLRQWDPLIRSRRLLATRELHRDDLGTPIELAGHGARLRVPEDGSP